MNRQVILLSLCIALTPSAYGGWDGLDRGGEVDEAMNLTPNLEHGEEIYQTCAFCHTESGWGMASGIGSYRGSGTYPQIAGQHQSVLIKQVLDIRKLNRDNPTMYPFALPESIGDEQAIADVTDYIAKLPMNPNNGKGDGDNLAHGEKLYKANCIQCHGEAGEGNQEKFYPKIQGQHYAYMLRQFEWIRDGKRRNANPDMVKQIAGFSDADMRAVIDYVSQIPVPKEDLAPVGWINPDYD